jgi:hypothetical protein
MGRIAAPSAPDVKLVVTGCMSMVKRCLTWEKYPDSLG